MRWGSWSILVTLIVLIVAISERSLVITFIILVFREKFFATGGSMKAEEEG
jgi:hypothetical protein